MSLSVTIRALKAEVRRLEDAAGKGRRNCPFCRRDVRRRMPDPVKPKPEDVVKTRCEHCGSEYLVDLNFYSGVSREIILLLCPYVTEDFFTDPKAYALYLWVDPERDLLKGGDRAPAAAARPKATKSAELRAVCDRLERRTYRRLVDRYGEDPFPELTQTVEAFLHEVHDDHDPSLLPSEHSSRPEFDELEREERRWLARAELERVIFGGISSETEGTITTLRNKIDGLLEWPRSERRRREEAEARRREAEEQRLREERRLLEEAARLREEEEARRRAEEKEREKLERFMQQYIAATPSAKSF